MVGRIVIGRHADKGRMTGECYRWNYSNLNGRFGCDAESCTEEEKTHQAILALSLLVGLDEDECRLGYCTKPHGAQGKGEA
jgi:hypothetical protein